MFSVLPKSGIKSKNPTLLRRATSNIFKTYSDIGFDGAVSLLFEGEMKAKSASGCIDRTVSKKHCISPSKAEGGEFNVLSFVPIRRLAESRSNFDRADL